MRSIEFNFGHKLGNAANGLYKCPACGEVSLTVALGDPKNIGFFCSKGCTKQAIFKELALPELADVPDGEDFTVHLSSPVLPPPQPVKLAADKPPQKERLTWELLTGELAHRGWIVKFNLISQEIEINARSDTSNRLLSMDDLVTVLHSDLSGKYKGCTLDNLHAYVSYIAREDSYNPILDFLKTLEWDTKDRLKELYKLMGIAEDPLSQTLVMKWLMQSVALLFNDEEEPYGADGVLVLNGGQGLGKTSLFSRLALQPRWFHEGATIKDNDKDTTRRCVTVWITELGEVESTLKSDISALKAFITSNMDVYRPPYARSDRRVARRTSMCATCNSDRYLIDPTGNRRWWSVPITVPMAYDDIQAFEAEQLWAQIYATVAELDQKGRAACYRLTRSEQDQLAVRNGEFEKPLKGEMECRDLLQEAKDKGYTWVFMTVTQWKTENMDALRAYSVNQIGAALNHIGLTAHRKRINGGNAERGYELPTRVQVPAEIRAIK